MKVIIIFLIFFLSSCAIKELEPLKEYSLKEPTTVRKVNSSIYKNKILKVEIPLSISSEVGYKISYLYLKDNEGGYYINSQYKEPLNLQLTKILINTLSKSNLFKSVVPYNSDIIEDLKLESTIFKIEHQIKNNNSSFAIFEIEVRLIDSNSKTILKSKRFRYTKECKTTNAQGFIEAFNEILEQFSNDLINWLRG